MRLFYVLATLLILGVSTQQAFACSACLDAYAQQQKSYKKQYPAIPDDTFNLAIHSRTKYGIFFTYHNMNHDKSIALIDKKGQFRDLTTEILNLAELNNQEILSTQCTLINSNSKAQVVGYITVIKKNSTSQTYSFVWMPEEHHLL